MSQYANSHEPSHYDPYHDAPPQRSWLGRNWLWFVPTIILLPIFCCCGGGGLLVWWGVGEVLDTPAYKDSVALAAQDADVIAALGSPIKSPEGFSDLIKMMHGITEVLL